MAVDFSFKAWRDRLEVCKDLATEEKCEEYLMLLKIAEENLSYEVVVELIRTFSDADDFGLQERTRNILESADQRVFYPALVQELSGLIERSPRKQWAVTLVEIELEYGDFNRLLDYVSRSRSNDRDAFLRFVKSDEFLDDYPAVLNYL